MLFESQLCLEQIWFLWYVRSGLSLLPLVCDRDLRCSIGFPSLFITLSISWLFRSNSDAKFARRSQFQKFSNSSNDRFVRLNIRSSLRGSRVRPWASRNLIWRPKKILKQHKDISGHKFVSSINGTPDPVMNDFNFSWGNSISVNNRQLFGISGQNCRREFLSFPSKFENVSWEYSKRLWFRASRLSSAGGPSPPPFLIILESSCRRFLREVAPRLPWNLHCLQNPLPLHCRGRSRRLQALICVGSVLRARDHLLMKSQKQWRSTELIPLHSFLTVLWRNKLITGKSWYALSPVLSPLLMKIGALFLCNRC
jgi:hypothetical protein